MKVRVGFGLGTAAAFERGDDFLALVGDLERFGFDSLWLSERVTGSAPDPLVGLAVAAGATRRLKLGFSVLVLPGRNPVLLAKELATLDHLSDGRLLPAFGLGIADQREQQAFGVERGERAARFDEALPLLRRLWEEEAVDHRGRFYAVEGVSLRPKPAQRPLDVWLGGRAPSELRRVGRLGDGWLPSFSAPADVKEGRQMVEEAAAAAGRAIDPEHWGALVAYTTGTQLPDRVAAIVAARSPGRDPSDVVPCGLPALRAQIERFVDVGFSKFVVVPVDAEASVEALAEAVLDLQRAV